MADAELDTAGFRLADVELDASGLRISGVTVILLRAAAAAWDADT